MRNFLLSIVLILSANALIAQPTGFFGPRQETVPVWPDGAPNAFTYDASSDDWLVPVKNSLMYYETLVENKVSATMHIYPTGGHGFGWMDSYIYKSEWTAELERWFNAVVMK